MKSAAPGLLPWDQLMRAREVGEWRRFRSVRLHPDFFDRPEIANDGKRLAPIYLDEAYAFHSFRAVFGVGEVDGP